VLLIFKRTFLLYLLQQNVYRYLYSKDKIGEAEQGDVVLVHIEDWPARADSPLESKSFR
jgi:hypothetical protein